jgi:hypothetical protein
MSNLLTNIDSEIIMAPDQITADCWRAKRACYLVRMGRRDDAIALIYSIRDRYSREPIAVITVWLNLAEGLAAYFGGMSEPALQKVRRAHALASAARIDPLCALCAGWLAHLEFGLLKTDEMAAHIEQSFTLAGGEDHDTLARTSLVVAVALHTSNRYDLAKPWYSEVRLHAVAEGDDATLSALLHNMSSMGVMNLRQSVLTGSTGVALALDALMGADSTSSYDSLKGTLGLSTWIPLLRAYIASLTDEPHQALALYREHVHAAMMQGQSRMMPYIQADMAWCHTQIGQREAAQLEAEGAERLLTADVHVDDRAATHSRLSATYSALGLVDLANRHKLLAAESWNEFKIIQARIVDSLSNLVPNGLKNP